MISPISEHTLLSETGIDAVDADNVRNQRDFERRMGCPERWLVGATGQEDVPSSLQLPLPGCASLEGAALLATRTELAEVRAVLAKAP